MSSYYKRLLDTRTINANEKSAPQDVMDVGAYTKMEIQPRILKAGTAGTLYLEHAAVLEEEAFAQLGTVPPGATSNTPLSYTNFLRFLRWRSSSDVAGSPLGLVDVIAKEG